MSQRKFIYGMLAALFVLSIIPAGIILSSKEENLRVIFFDVGQGDAVLVSYGSNQALIDGGMSGKIIMEKLGQYVPFWDRNIELIIATHPDQDHIGGLTQVLKNYEIGRVIDNGVSSSSGVFESFEKVIREKNIKKLEGEKNMKIKISNEAEMEIFHPDGKQNKNNPKDTNAGSFVLKLIFGENSFLFTGDLPIKEEIGLAGEGDNIDSQIIKIAHHGSKYSTSLEFLEKVSPEDAVISVGKNSYGHPSAEVLERLEKEGIRTLRTDERGDIIYECDKERCFLAKTFE